MISYIESSTYSPEVQQLRRLAMMVEYDGARYHGFQAQSNAISIQETLEEAIFNLTGEWLRVKGAGRTDSGVHAQGQVVSFDTCSMYDPSIFAQALNHYLPGDISVKSVERVAQNFDPRRWAISREYRYTILNSEVNSPLLRGFVYNVRRPLDTMIMLDAARLLEGEMNFAPFTRALYGESMNTSRIVFTCSVNRTGNMVFIDMEANGFLQQQVRRTAAALLEVGLGHLELNEFRTLSESGKPGVFSNVLPAKGLSLMRVNYPMPLFSSERTLNVRVGEIFEESHI